MSKLQDVSVGTEQESVTEPEPTSTRLLVAHLDRAPCIHLGCVRDTAERLSEKPEKPGGQDRDVDLSGGARLGQVDTIAFLPSSLAGIAVEVARPRWSEDASQGQGSTTTYARCAERYECLAYLADIGGSG